MGYLGMKWRTLAMPLVIAALVGAAPPPKTLPPGMTPKIYQMMMVETGPAHPKGIPSDAKPFLGCVPTMGYHYINPKNAPFGPLYGWYDGKPTFTEIMVAKTDFEKGGNWDEQLKPLPGYQIDHVDIWFASHGHPGYPQPHYDIHAWYVGHAEHMKYCANPSGQRPAFLR